jgi:hypothetical protein
VFRLKVDNFRGSLHQSNIADIRNARNSGSHPLGSADVLNRSHADIAQLLA